MSCKVIIDDWIVSGIIVGINDNGYLVDTGEQLIITDKVFKSLIEAVKY